MPWSIALRATASAAICAANGVDFLEPLKPRLPAEAQAITLPWLSEIVTIVLLKDECTCATPEPMFLNSRRLRGLVCFLAAKRYSEGLSCPAQRGGVSSPRPARRENARSRVPRRRRSVGARKARAALWQPSVEFTESRRPGQ